MTEPNITTRAEALIGSAEALLQFGLDKFLPEHIKVTHGQSAEFISELGATVARDASGYLARGGEPEVAAPLPQALTEVREIVQKLMVLLQHPDVMAHMRTPESAETLAWEVKTLRHLMGLQKTFQVDRRILN